ncbi:peptide/nickel transport system permease protein [Pacificibacter maritimus]|uniref:Peptide/nickel transport system permease protein n=1 Tax=Pacificibacter maritimus TaxID=762213 RepID=A0A3N4UQ31_9RHOB|nr:ABC transporter permease [Pacificibacter maritimus]RPE72168.1 peptide/nickel transport system permease protein [Pacificibacter maritimus]
MFKYISSRLLASVPIVLFVAIFVFLLSHLAPGDPAALIAGENATPEQIAQIRDRLHLDEPLVTQFGYWFSDILRFDLGNSIFSNRPVTELIAARLEPTLVLTSLTIVLTIFLAVPAGVIAAWKVNSTSDRSIMILSVLGFSVPAFLIGYANMYVFALKLGWFPVQGYANLSDGVLGTLRSVALPAFTITLVFWALVARITRAAMIEILQEGYTRTARAKGLSEGKVLFVHALKNAGVPISTVIGVGIAILISGVVVTESVFNIPGIGRLVVDAITQRDFPVVQGTMIFFSVVLIVVNLLVDLSYVLFDPRIRY